VTRGKKDQSCGKVTGNNMKLTSNSDRKTANSDKKPICDNISNDGYEIIDHVGCKRKYDMYLAPINYDRFFKKIFSDPETSKVFLEDFLDVTIQEIEPLPVQQRFTDEASIVEFDYRCKIDDSYVIIDMQQWYKLDVTQRFYVYHSLNTGLQLEGLPDKSIFIPHKDGKVKPVKDYTRIEPVTTIIWMADDALGHDEDYVTYRLYPEAIADFMKRDCLWHLDGIKDLMAQREKLLTQLNNKTKDIDFLPKNSLVFMFQKNIVRNAKMGKYYRWFLFAEKTKNKDNKKEDFKEFEGDELFQDIIRRLEKSTLSPADFKYIHDQEEFIAEVTRTEQGWWNGGLREGRREGEQRGRKERDIEIAREMLRKGMDVKTIADCTGLSVEEVEALRDSKP
jgi:hypothetical protein